MQTKLFKQNEFGKADLSIYFIETFTDCSSLFEYHPYTGASK